MNYAECFDNYCDLGIFLSRTLDIHPSVTNFSVIGNLTYDSLDIEVIVDKRKYVMDCLIDPTNNIKNFVKHHAKNLNNIYLNIVYE